MLHRKQANPTTAWLLRMASPPSNDSAEISSTNSSSSSDHFGASKTCKTKQQIACAVSLRPRRTSLSSRPAILRDPAIQGHIFRFRWPTVSPVHCSLHTLSIIQHANHHLPAVPSPIPQRDIMGIPRADRKIGFGWRPGAQEYRPGLHAADKLGCRILLARLRNCRPVGIKGRVCQGTRYSHGAPGRCFCFPCAALFRVRASGRNGIDPLQRRSGAPCSSIEQVGPPGERRDAAFSEPTMRIRGCVLQGFAAHQCNTMEILFKVPAAGVPGNPQSLMQPRTLMTAAAN